MATNLSRRSFIAGSAAVGGMMFGMSGKAAASNIPSKWNFEADVIVVGAGASGIPAAIRAAEAGHSVLVVDANYDIGGHAIISQGNTALGGGNAHQKKYGIKDDPETVFKDLTDWSVTLPNGFADYRFNDRDMQRMLADEMVPTYDWLVKIGVPFLDKAPDNAGAYATGCSAPRELHFNWTKGASLEAPAGTKGTVLMRALEDAARKAGVKFLMNFYMDEIVADEKGRAIGIRAHRTPKILPDGTELKGFRASEDVVCTEKEIAVSAKKALVIATAGYTDNVAFRRMVDPRLTAEFASAACEYSPQDASGTLAAMKLGAGLWGLTNAYTERPISLTRGAVIGVRDTYLRWAPESPIFPLVKHTGVSLRDWQNAIVVNWCGKRFFEETSSAGLTADSLKNTSYGSANSTRGLMDGTNGNFFKDKAENPYVQGDYKNIARTKYNPINFIAAALQINEGSHAPDWSAGPQWAIFDSEAVKRERMHTDEKSVDPQYFFKADSIEELAEKINTNPWMSHKMDPKALAETVAKYNSYVDQGKDPDFDKPTPKHKIEKGPFYAAWTSVTLHDCYCGLHVTNHCEVLTWEGEKIPGLYATGEVTGGSSMHGLSRGLVQSYVLGKALAALK
ncbi:FAD-binding protein [Sutterella sp.]|uniref:FAD-dependent oxidoreductase n=1 Tax=Sutterella sp. TaxID=1981025 RepID=UPI0026DF1BBD|nr:FAD-binding protein [Sutterella sp.]MDO5532443.1 FAD-binding protein [Sutterella sp.]